MSTGDLRIRPVRGLGGPTDDVSVEPWGSTLLLVQDNPGDVGQVRSMLEAGPAGQFHVTHVRSLGAAQEALSSEDFSIVLLDLSVQDAHERIAIDALLQTAPQVPFVVIGEWHEQRRALEAVHAGVHDFVMKRELDSATLGRSLRYAIEKKRAEGRLANLAHYDQLTQLPNRTLFQQRLEQAVLRAELASEQVGLLYIDIDCFEEVVEACGKEAGNRVLRAVAQRLETTVRALETVARLGHSEFCVVLADIKRVADAQAVAARLLRALAQPIEALDIEISARIGVALAAPGDSVEVLLERADYAVQRAPVTGDLRIHVAAPSTSATEVERLREAFDNREFCLFYQPRLSLDQRQIKCVEALLRWDDPERGLQRPREFMATLEHDDELMMRVSEWVVSEACTHLRQWRQAGLPKLRVSVNLCASHFLANDLIAGLTAVADRTGLARGDLEVDCAEPLLMDNPARSRKVLRNLQTAGFRTAIDDFGSGFGHLAELARLPLDVLKIDRAVVDDLDDHPARRALVAAAIALGRELALEVVAEGVERETQVRILEEMGATAIQGYWLTEPKSIEAFTHWWTCRTSIR